MQLFTYPAQYVIARKIVRAPIQEKHVKGFTRHQTEKFIAIRLMNDIVTIFFQQVGQSVCIGRKTFK